MDTDLSSLLSKQEIRAETIKYLESIGCKSIVLFANWVDSSEGLNEVASKGPHKSEHVETVRLKAFGSVATRSRRGPLRARRRASPWRIGMKL